MARHTILAPSPRSAHRLALALDTMGYQARSTVYHRAGKRHAVVLAIAPQGVVDRLCQTHSAGGL